MGNPTKIEALYDGVETWWLQSKLVSFSGRMTAFPSVVVIIIAFIVWGYLASGLANLAVQDADRSVGLAVFLSVLLLGFFASMTVLVIRKTIRDNRS